MCSSTAFITRYCPGLDAAAERRGAQDGKGGLTHGDFDADHGFGLD
jgi:hypothetical protein